MWDTAWRPPITIQNSPSRFSTAPAGVPSDITAVSASAEVSFNSFIVLLHVGGPDDAGPVQGCYHRAFLCALSYLTINSDRERQEKERFLMAAICQTYETDWFRAQLQRTAG